MNKLYILSFFLLNAFLSNRLFAESQTTKGVNLDTQNNTVQQEVQKNDKIEEFQDEDVIKYNKHENSFGGILGRFLNNQNEKEHIIFLGPFLARIGYFNAPTRHLEQGVGIPAGGIFFDLGGEIFTYSINQYLTFLFSSTFGWHFARQQVYLSGYSIGIHSIELNEYNVGITLTENLLPYKMSLDLYAICGYGNIYARIKHGNGLKEDLNQLYAIWGFGLHWYPIQRVGLNFEFVHIPINKMYTSTDVFKLDAINLVKVGLVIKL
jgi:hypothetical protein